MGELSKSLLDFHKEWKTKNRIEEEDIKIKIRDKVKTLWASRCSFDAKTIEYYATCILDIVKNNDLEKLIYDYSFNDSSNESLHFAILKTVVQYCINFKNTHVTELIQMTIDWNRHDVAKRELLDESIDWVNFFSTSFFSYFKTNFVFTKLESETIKNEAFSLLKNVITEQKFDFANLLMDHGIRLTKIIDDV